MKKIIIAVIFISAVFYVACSVAAADFNISNWDERLRTFIAFCWVMAVMVATFYFATEEKFL